ncbi:valine--tRNA ligase [Diatrype stigma]|uniref:Valine--tRNA ligase n=1 Tax=Diatrype stigma TaxID=117547 RepID=A0AAN9USD1_9PEZI
MPNFRSTIYSRKGPEALPAAGKGKKKKAETPEPEEEPLPDCVEDTPVGEKKRLKSFDNPRFKAYNPIAVESP